MSEVDKKGPPLRILHFSDIHVSVQIRHMYWKKWFSKRAIGAINLIRGRAKFFDEVEGKMQALVRFKEENNIDLVINTGDYTALGLESELILAKEMVLPLMNTPKSYVTLPGNHDIYVHERESHLRFSEQFSEVMQSDMPEACSDGPWPLVKLIGDEMAVIAINSARPNPLPWRSNGKISQTQLDSLKEILQDEDLKDRFIFVATHYAPRLENGKDDAALHGLVHADDFLSVCSEINFGAILCGHIHKTYRVFTEGFESDIFCAGSATMEGKEGFWVYEVDKKKIEAKRVVWNGEEYHFEKVQRNTV